MLILRFCLTVLCFFVLRSLSSEFYGNLLDFELRLIINRTMPLNILTQKFPIHLPNAWSKNTCHPAAVSDLSVRADWQLERWLLSSCTCTYLRLSCTLLVPAPSVTFVAMPFVTPLHPGAETIVHSVTFQWMWYFHLSLQLTFYTGSHCSRTRLIFQTCAECDCLGWTEFQLDELFYLCLTDQSQSQYL